MMAVDLSGIGTVFFRLDELALLPDDRLFAEAEGIAEEFLALGETVLEAWLKAAGQVPTCAKVEGFRLLALHRQGARGNPSFNACRETCREIVYHYNLIRLSPEAADLGHRMRLAAMVVRHLALFVGGKLEVAGLGDFCCSSRPVRQAELLNPEVQTV